MDWFNYISLGLSLLCLFVLPSISVRWGPILNETNIIHIGQSASSSNTTSKSPFTTLSPNGQIVNVQLDSKGRPVRAKNRTYESIRDIINLDSDYNDEKYDYGEKNVPGIDGNGNLSIVGKQNLSTSNDNEIIVNSVSYNNTPSPVALPQISEFADGYHPYHYPSKPQSNDCPRIPSPTLTPSLPGRPRYVKIEWRKMILPPTSTSTRLTSPSSISSTSSTSSISSSLTSPSSSHSSIPSDPSTHKVELVIPNDFSPFYYRKVVDYGPNPSLNAHHHHSQHQHHPQLLAMPPQIPPLPISMKKNKKPSQIKFPNVFAGLMRSKKKKPKTKRPGYIYIPPQAEAPYPPPPPSSYYYGPVNLPIREPWPAETFTKFARNLKTNSNANNTTKS